MEYILIKETDIEKFNKTINNNLKNGWKLHGVHFSYQISDNIYHTQAMINDREPPEKPVIPSVEEILASWNV